MVTQIKPGEWMVEPYDENVREYARLHLKAMNTGLNVDGQAIIPWEELLMAPVRKVRNIEKQHSYVRNRKQDNGFFVIDDREVQPSAPSASTRNQKGAKNGR